MVNKYILSLGAELEGAVLTLEGFEKIKEIRKKLGKNKKRFEIGYDGSVNVRRDFNVAEDGLEIRYWSKNLSGLKRIFRMVWDCGFVQNATCGNHIHIRIRDENLLLWDDFPEFFIRKYLSEFSGEEKYLSRLGNRYCEYRKGLKLASDFLRNRLYNRYFSINFLSLKERQKTIEIRIMPYAGGFEEWLSQVIFVVNTVKDFIEGNFVKNYITKNVSVKKAVEDVDSVILVEKEKLLLI